MASRFTRGAAIVFATLIAACETAAPREEPLYDLVFEGRLANQPELLTYDQPSEGGRRVLAPGTVVMDPEPSPNGLFIAFVVADYTQGTGDIFIMKRDGTDVRQLTFDPELDDQPSWSPDGERIAFRSFRAGRDGDIWVMNWDGANQVNVFPDPLPGVIDAQRPDWSPNGSRIAFSSNEGGTYDIWTMRPDGSDRLQITNTADLDTEPTWFPSASIGLAFRRTSAATNSSDIFTVDARSGFPAAKPIELEGEQRQPRFVPDGTQIIFVNQESVTARPDLYIVVTDGTHFRPLVTDAVPGGSLNPAFLMRRSARPGFGVRP